MKMMKIPALILAILLLFTPLVACSDQTDEPAQTTTASDNPTNTGNPADTTGGLISDDLPANLNYNGTVVRILYWSDAENTEYFTEGIGGNMVDDAIYERNQAVEDRLGIKFEFVGEKGSYDYMSTFYNRFNNSYQAGDRFYDIVSSYSLSIAMLTYNGLCLDISSNTYINYEKPWWPENLLNQATINGKLYFLSGDLSTNMLYMMYVTYFNKDLIKELNLEDPYTLVDNNQWTIDKMFEMGSHSYLDKNANGIFDEEDQMALMTSTLHSEAYLWGAGIRGVDRDAAGNLIVSSTLSSEKAIDVITKIGNYFTATNYACFAKSASPRGSFDEGRLLFCTDRADVGVTDIKSDMEYGIVPVCKYDSNQEEFYTILGNPFSLYCIPIDAKDEEMSGAVLECLGSEGYRKITPALFELTMKVRYTYDNDSARMYDIIRASTVYDLGRLFNSQLGGQLISKYRAAVSSGSTNWASDAKAITKTMETKLKTLQDKLAG